MLQFLLSIYINTNKKKANSILNHRIITFAVFLFDEYFPPKKNTSPRIPSPGITHILFWSVSIAHRHAPSPFYTHSDYRNRPFHLAASPSPALPSVSLKREGQKLGTPLPPLSPPSATDPLQPGNAAGSRVKCRDAPTLPP